MDWTLFRDWCLADFGKAERTVYYNVGRLQSMQRGGLDVEAFLADPDQALVQGRRLIAKLKAAGKGGHVVRTQQKALNWLAAYAESREPNRAWKRWDLVKEPSSMPMTVDAADLAQLWSYTSGDRYMTVLRRALAFVAYHGNFRRGELAQLRLSHLSPATGQIFLPLARKGGISGAVEVPWSMYWPDSPLLDYLRLRVPVEGSDALWTIRSRRRAAPGGQVLGAAALYTNLRQMGKELGVPLNFIRTRRRQLSDLDDRATHPRVLQQKGRHVTFANTERYLKAVTGQRARAELAQRGMPGYEAEARHRVVTALPGAIGGAPLVDGKAKDLHGRPDLPTPAGLASALTDSDLQMPTALTAGVAPLPHETTEDNTMQTPPQGMLVIKKGAEWRPTGPALTGPAGLPPQGRLHRVPAHGGKKSGTANAFTPERAVAPVGAVNRKELSPFPPTRKATPAELAKLRRGA